MAKNYYVAFKDALKTLIGDMKALRSSEDSYRARVAKIEQQSNDLSPNAKAKMLEEAKNSYLANNRRLAIEAEDALNVIRENRDFPDAVLDFQNPKLQNALAVLNVMGNSLPHEDQLAILHGFRGQIAELRFLSKAFEKNGLYYADAAMEMAKPISGFAIDEASAAIQRVLYNGKWEISLGVTPQFEKALTRYGWNDNAETDPYTALLMGMYDGAEDKAEKDALAIAIKKINATDENGSRLTTSAKNDIVNELISGLKEKEAELKRDRLGNVINQVIYEDHATKTQTQSEPVAASAEPTNADRAAFGLPPKNA